MKKPIHIVSYPPLCGYTAYFYGMRLRGFSPGCQPMEGLRYRKDDKTGEFYDILVYDRKLTNEELRAYELTYIGLVTNWTEEGLARAGSSNHNFLKEDV